jgi:glycogen(starch) synthase
LPFHWGQNLGVRWYEQFVVLTDDMKRTIEALNPKADCRVLPNGVSDEFYAIEPRVGDFMLFLGRIEVHAKGLDVLLQAMARLPEARRPRLVLAGSGFQEAELLQCLKDTGMRPWVDLVGHVQADRRAQLLRDCRFMVMPSRVETFGMTLAEANAAGQCTVIFDAAPMNEVAAPNSPRAKAFDADSLASVIDHTHHLPDAVLAEMGMAARQWARRYDWDAVAAQQEAFYLQACER